MRRRGEKPAGGRGTHTLGHMGRGQTFSAARSASGGLRSLPRNLQVADSSLVPARLVRNWQNWWPDSHHEVAVAMMLYDAVGRWDLRDVRVLDGGEVAVVAAATRKADGLQVVVKASPLPGDPHASDHGIWC